MLLRGGADTYHGVSQGGCSEHIRGRGTHGRTLATNSSASDNTSVQKVFILLIIGALAGGGYYAYNMAGAKMAQADTYRVLEEAGTKARGSKARLQAEHTELESFKAQLKKDLQLVGVTDPKAEVWVEFDDDAVRGGVVYTSIEKDAAGKDVPKDVELEHRSEY